MIKEQQLRCQKCRKLLGIAEKMGYIQIKCPRCSHINNFCFVKGGEELFKR